ncbi:MAG TPA: S8 family serine peptidase, partial [Chthonomonadaceae bacterium]|nr:S8 family serine peptidase [Chthonomonadaceae bacterium]
MNDTNSTRPLRAFTCLLVALLGLWLGLPQRVFAVTQEEVVPGEVVVGLRPESDSLGIAQRLSDFGASTSHLHAIHAYRLRLRPGLSIDTALAQLRQRPEVLYAEPNHILHIFATPNDYYYGQQYGPQKVQANLAWGLWNPQTTVVIAIVDTGIDNTHPDLTNKIYRDVNGIVGYNGFTELRSNALDDNGHGTHCAGIAAAQINNGVGVAGIAGWNGQANSSDADHIKLMPVKVMDNTGSGTDISVANGIIWAADHGAKVISMSLGSDTSSDTMANAVQYAWSKGCVIAAAAGNSGSSAFSYPGAYPNVISVAATDNTDTLASFSNYGSWVSVAAPGVNIVSTTPTYSTGWPLNYASASGTSMATPHVAGEAALLLAQNPNLTNSQVYNLIIGNVDPYVPNGTHTLATGRGRINVYRALLAATPATTAPNVPANLAAATGSGQVYLAWNPSTGATGYNVKRATTSGGPYTTIASNVASPSYLNTGLTNGTTYYYVVSAVNSIGESANSAQVRATPVNVVRVNSGGGQYISFNSGIWSGDSYYSGGSTYSVGTRTIANTSDPTLYLSERYSGTSFSYTLPAS